MQDYEKIAKKIISDISGVEPGDLIEEAYFEDDLNIGEIDLLEIFHELEEKFEIDLSEEKDSLETVGDLIGALHEKLE